jgi:HD-GYP domain-containing protein (c-di-GMP phosphodiesterase class II)
VIPFRTRYESLLEAVASQAAIAIENNRMMMQIEKQFDEFVKASVTAIESRDTVTSGHSGRVADLCVRMAKAINAESQGVFADIAFSANQLKELELAGLLHDFGKVYLDRNIFLKGNKLFPKDFSYLMMRLAFLYKSIELYYSEETKSAPSGIELTDLEKEKSLKLRNLLEIMELVDILNRPLIQQGDPENMLRNVEKLGGDLRYRDLEGKAVPVLTGPEKENLAIKQGTLNSEERRIIESHVEHSYTFVSKIPWPPELKNIPQIVLMHHEKLDGSGYPEGLKGQHAIPLAARIMCLADIFDALAAPDRPYKRSVPLDRVLMILKEEGKANKLDMALVDLFIEKKLYQNTERK